MFARAYLDESEERGTGIFAVGGFVGKASMWEALEPRWLAALPDGISYFHATDCFGGRREFEHLDIPVRVKLLDTLTDLILEHEIFMIGGTVLVPVYQEYAPKRLENDFGGNKYTAAFEFAIELACQSLDNSPIPRDICKQVDFYIERHESYTQSLQRRIPGFKNDENLWWRNRIGTDTYGTKIGAGAIPMLQVADLGAFFAAKLVSNVADGRIRWRPYFDKLMNGHRVFGVKHADEKSLRIMHGIHRSLANGDRDEVEEAIDEVFNNKD
jgi:hypothetical protein